MNTKSCLFCRLIHGVEKGWIVYEDEHHVAFLTPFPNTPGFTVLATREHLSSYVPELPEERFAELLRTARTVALMLDRTLGTKRTAVVMEGMAIDHAHIKLIPLHGIPDGAWSPIISEQREFHDVYQGYLTTHDGPRMSDTNLDEIQALICGDSRYL